MKRDTALAAQQFLARVELKGIEVPAFIEVMESLDKFIKPQPGLEVPETPVSNSTEEANNEPESNNK